MIIVFNIQMKQNICHLHNYLPFLFTAPVHDNEFFHLFFLFLFFLFCIFLLRGAALFSSWALLGSLKYKGWTLGPLDCFKVLIGPVILRFLAVKVDWGRFELRAANIPNLFSLTPIAHYIYTLYLWETAQKNDKISELFTNFSDTPPP